MAVLGKVAGTMLKDNLLRNGVDLVIDSNLMYYDVNNRRIGINTISPGNALTVNGSVTASNIYVNDTSVTALNGNLILNSLTGNINVSTLRIFNVVDPVGDQDAATKKYVDTNISAIASPNLYIGNLNNGNTNVVLNSETLYLVGNSNQINVAISSNSATFSLASNIVIGNLNTTNGGQLTGYLTGAIGANTANSGVFTSVATVNGGQLTGYITGPIGANTANSGVFTSVATVNGGQVTGYLTGAIGSNTANSGAFTSITATQTAGITGNLTAANITATGAGGQVSGYLTGAIGANIANTASFTTVNASSNINTTAQFVSTYAGSTSNNGGQIVLNGATINRIDFPTGVSGLGDPNVTVRSPGTKIVLWPLVDGSGVDYAIGLTSGVLWNSVHDETRSFKWFANTGAVATLTGLGNFTVQNQLIGYLNGAIGANTANSGVFTSVTTTSGGQLTGYHTGAIGANTANIGVFTSVTTTNGGQVTGYLTGAIGANTANSGAFTTVTATGNISGANIAATGAGGQISGYLTGAIGSNIANTGIFTNVTTTGSSGNISGANYIFASLFSGNLTGAVGNINPNSGIFTSVTTVSGGQLTGYLTGPIGANTANTGAFTSLTSTGNISGANIAATGVGGQISGYLTGAIGSNVANTGAFTTVTATGNISGANIAATGAGGQISGYLTGAIGSNIANTGAFTSITATQTAGITGNLTAANITASGSGGQVSGYLTGAIGANVANTGAFTSISASTLANIGNLYIHNNTIDVINTDGNINLTPVGNGIVSINSTKAILLPSGNNLARPPNPIIGMFRYNTVINSLEIWDGLDWIAVSGTATTTIVSDSFTGNGSDKDFTLSQSTTTSGALVSINGVSQIPGVSYTINDVTLTFIEAPLSTDIIEARMLTTTGSTTSMVVGNSYVNFGSPVTGYPFNIHISEADRVIFYAANTTILNNLVTSTGIYWPNGTSYASPPGGINSSLQFNNSQVFGGATYLSYNSSSGNLVSNSTTRSTSLTTGAVVIGNGLAVGGNVFANAIYSDNHFFANGVTITTPAGGTNTMMQFNDNTNFSGTTYLQYSKTSGNLVSNSTTTSTSTTTGAIVVGGGVGIGGNLNVGNNLTVTSNAQIASLGIGTAATGTAGEIRATNNITGYYSSDISLKENVSVITNALNKVNNIRGVEFDWSAEFITNHGGEDGYFIRKHDIGVIAQEIEMVLPEVVATRENGIKAVKYDRVVALLIEAIKELQAKVDKLEKGQ